MRWEVRAGTDKEHWHRWFAWHPVKVGNQYVWLERIYRKAGKADYGGWDWEYRIEGTL